ncbi:MAG: GTPase Era, partial [Alphaproteobacteria bacterium]
TFMISALKGDGLADLMAEICGRMPEGPWLFPEDQVSDQPTQFFATEITREKLFLRLRQELPYALTVETELWTENKDGSVRIDQTIYVERESQKPIIVGKGGRQIKEIGQAARQELERFLNRRVHLFLHVKTRENWAEQREHFRSLDLDYDA